ncbi:Alpha-mannosidase 2C1 [Irineochytrium annulatum]|nr:Alpha-mannosidase 2C1 [Irineochytrium annulatum]
MAPTTASARPKSTSNLNTLQKHRAITVERLEKFLDEGQFEDVNLRSALWAMTDSKCVDIKVHAVPDLKRIPFKDALKGDFKPTKIGESFGPSWATFWFELTITIPDSFAGKEVLLIFDPSCEGLIWSDSGEPLQGLTGTDGKDRHVDHILTTSAKANQKFHLYVETGCNGMFGNGEGIRAPEPDRTFKIKMAEVAVADADAHALWWDFEILVGIVKECEGTQVASDALYAANEAINRFRAKGAYGSVRDAREITAAFLRERDLEGQSDHQITAIGNCHIDTAWLWPYGETKRKCARSFATQCTFMETRPHYKFTASQAQQFEWVEELYPKLFERMKGWIKKGQFIPIGGTWVEMDCNVPSGEGFCRQFLHGQRYFESRFGKRCGVFWLPDTFGYSAQLPQIVKESGLKYFFTQKLSWNNINKFPHTTFMWTGLDGTSILTHFSPADTYVAQGTVRDVTFSVKNNKDKEYTHKSLMLYGNGDGGGGPLVPMIERLNRLKRIRGLPATVEFGSPEDFFVELEKSSRDLVEWKGELYFELHRGTYTTHGAVKRYNRKLEYLLRDVELLATLAITLNAADGKSTSSYVNPKAELDRLWKLVLLNQFHDVLPGSSIELVYVDALEYYRDVEQAGTRLKEEALGELRKRFENGGAQAMAVLNTTGWTTEAAVIEVEMKGLTSGVELFGGATWMQMGKEGKALVVVDNVPAMSMKSFGIGNKPAAFTAVKAESAKNKEIVLENAFVKVILNRHGQVVSLYDKRARRESIAAGQLGNVFKIFEDIPLFWDAWDVEVYHLEKGWDAGVGEASVEESGPVRAVVKVRHPITETSWIEQRIILTAVDAKLDFETKIEWDENRVMLKVEFPLAINCDYATYETQFGYIQRPTHYNNSWDLARFEVCGHKYADLSEYGFGVALLNDCKYGYSVLRNVMRLSLLRAPKAPDAHADIGTHVLKYALYPHQGAFLQSDVVRQAYQYNVPLIALPMLVDPNNADAASSGEFFKVDMENVVLDTVKMAEDPRKGGNDVVIRLYEAYGGRGTVKISTQLPVKEAHFTNVLEDLGEKVDRDAEGNMLVPIMPFKFVTIRMIISK